MSAYITAQTAPAVVSYADSSDDVSKHRILGHFNVQQQTQIGNTAPQGSEKSGSNVQQIIFQTVREKAPVQVIVSQTPHMGTTVTSVGNQTKIIYVRPTVHNSVPSVTSTVVPASTSGTQTLTQRADSALAGINEGIRGDNNHNNVNNITYDRLQHAGTGNNNFVITYGQQHRGNTFRMERKAMKCDKLPGTNLAYRTPGANFRNKNGRIKRPMNAFMVWARDFRGKLAQSMPSATNSEISVKLGQVWSDMTPDEKRSYYAEAERIKHRHRQDFPDWVYKPAQSGKKREEVTPSPSLISPSNSWSRYGTNQSSATTNNLTSQSAASAQANRSQSATALSASQTCSSTTIAPRLVPVTTSADITHGSDGDSKTTVLQTQLVNTCREIHAQRAVASSTKDLLANKLKGAQTVDPACTLKASTALLAFQGTSTGMNAFRSGPTASTSSLLSPSLQGTSDTTSRVSNLSKLLTEPKITQGLPLPRYRQLGARHNLLKPPAAPVCPRGVDLAASFITVDSLNSSVAANATGSVVTGIVTNSHPVTLEMQGSASGTETLTSVTNAVNVTTSGSIKHEGEKGGASGYQGNSVPCAINGKAPRTDDPSAMAAPALPVPPSRRGRPPGPASKLGRRNIIALESGTSDVTAETGTREGGSVLGDTGKAEASPNRSRNVAKSHTGDGPESEDSDEFPEEDMWPFPFPEVPLEPWTTDECRSVYSELLDPSDVLLYDGEPLYSELFPGSLRLDISGWQKYLEEDVYSSTSSTSSDDEVDIRRHFRSTQQLLSETGFPDPFPGQWEPPATFHIESETDSSKGSEADDNLNPDDVSPSTELVVAEDAETGSREPTVPTDDTDDALGIQTIGNDTVEVGGINHPTTGPFSREVEAEEATEISSTVSQEQTHIYRSDFEEEDTQAASETRNAVSSPSAREERAKPENGNATETDAVSTASTEGAPVNTDLERSGGHVNGGHSGSGDQLQGTKSQSVKAAGSGGGDAVPEKAVNPFPIHPETDIDTDSTSCGSPNLQEESSHQGISAFSDTTVTNGSDEHTGSDVIMAGESISSPCKRQRSATSLLAENSPTRRRLI